MNSIQQFLFPEMMQPLAVAEDLLKRFRNLATAHNEFIRSIAAAIHTAGSGSLVLVGCSPVIDPTTFVADLVKSCVPGAKEGRRSARDLPVLEFAAPPCVMGLRDQLRVLHDRYRNEADHLSLPAMDLELREGKLVKIRSSETEALCELLRQRAIRLVCITHGENLISGSASVACSTRLLDYLADVGRRSGAVHVVFGSRRPLILATKNMANPPKIVLQPLYDPLDAKDTPATGDQPKRNCDCTEFQGILRYYDTLLKGSANFELSSHRDTLMVGAGGDPCRLAQWISAAVCRAAGQGSAQLKWVHLRAARPSLEEYNEAQKDLAAYLEHTFSADVDEMSPHASPPETSAKKGRRPGRNPTRDIVPRAA